MARVEYTFDPFDITDMLDAKDKLSPSSIKSVLNDVQTYVLEEVLSDTAEQRSAVYGTRWKKLSKDYAKIKVKKGGTPIANLELSSDMLSSLKIIKKADKLTLTVGANEQGKADGHNNFSGDSKLPLRRFIPNDDDGDTFRPAIREGIKSIIDDALAQEPQPNDQTQSLQDLVDQGVTITLRRSG